MSDRGDQIFIDKLRLTSAIVERELNMNQMYNSFFSLIKQGEIKEEKAEKDQDFFLIWELLVGLYDFMEFDYAMKWGSIKNNKNEYEELKGIVEQYRISKRVQNIKQLRTAYTIIRKILAWANFHDVTTMKQSKRDLLKPTTTW